MESFYLYKNGEINDDLLRKVTLFDREEFPLEEDHSFPDGYLENLYKESRDCFFIMLDDFENIAGYTHSIFISDKNKEYYLSTRDYLGLRNIGFKEGDNNLYFYSLVVDPKYRHTDLVKQLMRRFTEWLDEEKKKGKKIKSCISEAITQEGIETLTRMGMKPQDTDKNGLGIYYSPDCLKEYIREMNQERKLVNMDVSSLTTKEKMKSVKNDYDDIAKEYAVEFYGDDSDNHSILRFLSNLNGKRVLDAGCGCGEDCKFMDENGYEACGIDFSQGMLSEARERYPKGKFKEADMTKIPCSDHFFDGVLANCSFMHIPSEIQGIVLDEFKRVLKPGGRLLMILLEGNGETMLEEPYRPGEVYVYTKFFTADEIKELLQEHGFKVDDIEVQKTTSAGELGEGKLIVYAEREKIIELDQTNTRENDER